MVVLLHPHSDRFTRLSDRLPVPGPDELHLQPLDQTFGQCVASRKPPQGPTCARPPSSGQIREGPLQNPCPMECSIPSRATSRHLSTVSGSTPKRKATWSAGALPGRGSTTASLPSSTLLRPGRPRRTPDGSSAFLRRAPDPVAFITSTANLPSMTPPPPSQRGFSYHEGVNPFKGDRVGRVRKPLLCPLSGT
jgi:hypothetical protein